MHVKQVSGTQLVESRGDTIAGLSLSYFSLRARRGRLVTGGGPDGRVLLRGFFSCDVVGGLPARYIICGWVVRIVITSSGDS